MYKLTYNYIKESFNNEGYILMSNNYINSRTKLKFICPNGHAHEISWNKWRIGRRCKFCRSMSMLTPIEDIIKLFSTENYTLHTTAYTGPKTRLQYTCPFGHKHTTILSRFKMGIRCPTCADISYSINYSKDASHLWKGGITESNLPLYETFSYKLKQYQNVFKVNQDGLILLGVECKYCGKIFVPKATHVNNRLQAIAGRQVGEANFYCSGNCKKACPTYRKIKYEEGEAPMTSREVQPQLRKLVLERDNYSCSICGKNSKDVELHCHHETGVLLNPIESADIDNCITLCKDHHKHVHRLPGCTYKDLRCK